MPLDRRLLDILCCPVTRQPLALMPSALLTRLNRAIAAGSVRNESGELLEVPLEKALLSADHKRVYPVLDGIPSLLPESALVWSATDQTPPA